MVAPQRGKYPTLLSTLRKKQKVGKALFRIVLQIHDAVLLEVPVEHVAEVVDNIIPAAMVDGVPIYRTHLDGMPADDKPYHMGVDTNIYTYWGENLMPDDCKKLNVHPKYAGFIKATDGGWTHREMKAGQKWLKGRWVPLTTSSKT